MKLRLQQSYVNFFRLVDKVDTMLDKRVCERNSMPFDVTIVEEHMTAVLRSIEPRSVVISAETMEKTKQLKKCLSSIHSRGIRI